MFERISIPLVRRIYPSLIANNLVAVQPLAGPATLIHYLRHQYSQNSQGQHASHPKYKKPFIDKADWKTEGF